MSVPELHPSQREEDRLAVLRALNILDTEPEAEFDALVRAAALALDARMAMLSLIDRDRQWFKARANVPVAETPRDGSFCTHAIEQPGEVMVVADAAADPRFAESPLVNGPMEARFYAGAPVLVQDQPIGTLCVIDGQPRPRGLTQQQTAFLCEMTKAVANAVEARTVRARTGFLERQRRVNDIRVNMALEAANMTIWTWDVRSGKIVNFGRGRAEDEHLYMTPENVREAVLEEDREPVQSATAEAFEGRDNYTAEFRPASDPSTWLKVVGQVVERDAEARPLTITGIQYDITEEKHAAALAEAQALEMRHRVNNLFGLVDALATRTASETERLEDFTTLFRSRLQALARTQRLLMAGEGRATLEALARTCIEPFRRSDRSVIHIDLPDLTVKSLVAQTLTLTFHELTTNALKYGALRWPHGRVYVSGGCEGDCLRLEWREQAHRHEGDVPVDDFIKTASAGSGHSLIERMVRAQGGNIEFEFRQEQMTAALRLPLN